MAYCVHCGVKLATYEKVCPLCGTEVFDPHQVEADEAPFIDYIQTTDKHINRTFLASLMCIIGLLPIIVTIIVDLCINGKLSWSLYVLGAEVCIAVYCLIPYRYEFKQFWLYVFFDFIITAAYLLLINYLTGSGEWYFKLAFPLTLLVSIDLGCLIKAFQMKHLGKIKLAGYIILLLTIFPFGIDLIITHYLTSELAITWSLWVCIPLFIIGISFVLISKSTTLSEWVRRNLFI